MRTALILTTLALATAGLVPSFASAIYQESPSGEYLDMDTNVVYWYDAATGTLTPTTKDATASPVGYWDVTVTRYLGTRPAYAGGGLCFSTACIDAFAAVVGQHQVRLIINTPNVSCDTNVAVTGNLVVTSFSGSYFKSCGSGWYVGLLYIDGVQRDHSSIHA